MNVLDCLKVSDTTLLLVSAACFDGDYLDKWGKKILNMAVAQGLPTPIVSLMDLESINPKKRIQVKADITKMIQKSLPEEKPMQLDNDQQALNLLRRIGGQKKNILYNKNYRPHLFGEHVEFDCDNLSEVGTLKITGFIRGQPLDVNQLIYIAGLGDYQMSEIKITTNPHRTYNDFGNLSINDANLTYKADPNKQVPLIREIVPDEMDAEQNWPTEEEILHSKEETKKIIKRVPKGMSEYQATWIPDFEIKEIDKGKKDGDDDDDESNGDEEEYMSCQSSEESDVEKDGDDEDEEEYDTITVSEAPVNDDKYDQGKQIKCLIYFQTLILLFFFRNGYERRE